MDLNKISHRYNPASGISGARKIYMIGIKGVGMTMLAQYLHALGIEISGSDVAEKFMTDKVLKKAGIKVIEKFDVENIPKNTGLIIYSSAYIREQNVELAAAQDGKVKTMSYAEALGEVFNVKYGIAVVGSHGKTTTTAWLGLVLEKSGQSPSVLVGAVVPQFNGAGLVGKSDLMVIEADEYQNKLKYFNPRAVLLNNIDYDHPDYFANQEDYKQVFIEFIKKISKKGFLVANFDDPITRKIAKVNCQGRVITYAINEAADFVAYDIKSTGAQQYFKVHLKGDEDDVSELGDFCINLIGRHNISNALAVIAAAIELGVELTDIRENLGEFTGTQRRMQVLGKFRGAIIIDDYAHHPTEIKAVLSAARDAYKEHKLIVVFHPHTFSRTKVLLNDFANSFGQADEVIVLDIYGSAREKQGGAHSRDLVELIKKQKNPRPGGDGEKTRARSGPARKQEILYIPTLKECEEYLREQIRSDEVVLLMGAGDIFRIGENLVK